MIRAEIPIPSQYQYFTHLKYAFIATYVAYFIASLLIIAQHYIFLYKKRLEVERNTEKNKRYIRKERNFLIIQEIIQEINLFLEVFLICFNLMWFICLQYSLFYFFNHWKYQEALTLWKILILVLGLIGFLIGIILRFLIEKIHSNIFGWIVLLDVIITLSVFMKEKKPLYLLYIFLLLFLSILDTVIYMILTNKTEETQMLIFYLFLVILNFGLWNYQYHCSHSSYKESTVLLNNLQINGDIENIDKNKLLEDENKLLKEIDELKSFISKNPLNQDFKDRGIDQHNLFLQQINIGTVDEHLKKQEEQLNKITDLAFYNETQEKLFNNFKQNKNSIKENNINPIENSAICYNYERTEDTKEVFQHHLSLVEDDFKQRTEKEDYLHVEKQSINLGQIQKTHQYKEFPIEIYKNGISIGSISIDFLNNNIYIKDKIFLSYSSQEIVHYYNQNYKEYTPYYDTLKTLVYKNQLYEDIVTIFSNEFRVKNIYGSKIRYEQDLPIIQKSEFSFQSNYEQSFYNQINRNHYEKEVKYQKHSLNLLIQKNKDFLEINKEVEIPLLFQRSFISFDAQKRSKQRIFAQNQGGFFRKASGEFGIINDNLYERIDEESYVPMDFKFLVDGLILELKNQEIIISHKEILIDKSTRVNNLLKIPYTHKGA